MRPIVLYTVPSRFLTYIGPVPSRASLGLNLHQSAFQITTGVCLVWRLNLCLSTIAFSPCPLQWPNAWLSLTLFSKRLVLLFLNNLLSIWQFLLLFHTLGILSHIELILINTNHAYSWCFSLPLVQAVTKLLSLDDYLLLLFSKLYISPCKLPKLYFAISKLNL